MKTILLSLLFCGVTFAGDRGGEHPCKKIKAACEAAGFQKGEPKEGTKGLFRDCLKPLLEGRSIAGVTADPADIEACKAKRTAKAKKPN